MGNFNNEVKEEKKEVKEEKKEVKEEKRTYKFVDAYGIVYEVPVGHKYSVDPDKFGCDD